MLQSIYKILNALFCVKLLDDNEGTWSIMQRCGRDLDKDALEIHIKFQKDPWKYLYKIVKWIL